MTVCPTCKDRAKTEQKAEAQRQADEQRRAAEARCQLLGRKIEAVVAGTAPREPVLDELALREAAYLVAVERLADADGLLAFDVADLVRLAPTQELGDTILRTLHAEGYLALEPDPPADAFELDERDELTVIDYWSCRWRLAEMSGLRRAVASGWRPAGWERDALRVWKQVAVHDCLGYAARRVNYEAAGLVLLLTDELAGAIDDALGVFSTGQVYCLIWGAARDLRGREVFDGFEAARRLTAGIERRRSGRVTSESERAVRPFDRDRKPTLLCEALYDDLLKIGIRGFTERPHQFRADAP
jgi:hypothetical protein